MQVNQQLRLNEAKTLKELVRGLKDSTWKAAERLHLPGRPAASYETLDGTTRMPVLPELVARTWPLPARAYDANDAEVALLHGLTIVRGRAAGEWALTPYTTVPGDRYATNVARTYVCLGYLPPYDLLPDVALDGAPENPTIEDYLLGLAWARTIELALDSAHTLREEQRAWQRAVEEAFEA